MHVERNQVLSRENERPIVYDVFKPSANQVHPVVIFCHGYKGFKDWGAWDLVAQTFVEAGFTFFKFNFSHNGGTVAQPIDFPDLEAFAQNNFTKELDDLAYVIDFVLPKENTDIVSLIGHSRGGGIVSIKAQEDSRVQKVISWAGVSDFKARFHEGTEVFEQWQKDGVTYIENSRTKQQLPHYFQFYENFKANEERLTIQRAVSGLVIPHLVVHGSADPTVSVEEAIALHTWNAKSQLEIIENADHVFGARHPWPETILPNDLKTAVDRSIDFLKNTASN